MSDEGGGGGHGAVWLVSYADMVTLLLAFFIVMYTFSQVDAAKLEKVVVSMHQAFSPVFSDSEGGGPGKDAVPTISGGLVPGGAVASGRQTLPSAARGKNEVRGESRAERDLTAIVEAVRALAHRRGLDRQLKTEKTKRGVVITFAEMGSRAGGLVPFRSGSAELSPDFKRVLDEVRPILQISTSKIEVQGHTDRRPIHSALYPSNWELSCARAGSVVRYLLQGGHFRPGQFVAVGFAETMPVDSAHNPTAWGRNRRVDIVITRHPVESYDQLTRAEAASTKVDITQPLGARIVVPPVPAAVPHEAASDAAAGEHAH